MTSMERQSEKVASMAAARVEKPVVDRSTTGSNSGVFGGQSVDGCPAQRTRPDAVDDLKHLAKVRVADSNPVFRSIESGR